MKSWKKQEEKKEDNAWEQAIVSQEQKIANGEEVCDVMCMHVRTRRVFKRLLPQSDSRLDYCHSTDQHCKGVRLCISVRIHTYHQDEDVSMIEAEAALKAGAAAKATEPPPEEEEDGEMSAYEKQRLAKIKRNNAFLLNLGIDTLQAPVTPKPRPAPKAKSRRHDNSPSVTPGSAVPTRRSTRAAAGEVELKSKNQELESLEEQLQQLQETGDSEGGTEKYFMEQISLIKADIARIEEENAAKRAKLLEDSSRARARSWAEEEEAAEVELNYDDSSVKRYECESVRLRVPQADLTKGVQGIAPIEGATYHDTNLKKIYSISFRPCGKLVAAAGHGGIAGIFGIGSSEGSDGENVLLSWKAHQGWIGDVQFVSQQQAESASNLILSTSNDKTVVLWDINTAASAGRQVVPKRVATETWHSSGVFSMHEIGGRIATGSKDGNVVVAQFKDSKMRKSTVLENVLEGHVVKCVRLRPNISVEASSAASSVLACGGNSHTVRVLDVREGQTSKGGSTLAAANSAVSFVQWSPADENVLMSCRYGGAQCAVSFLSRRVAAYDAKPV
jgi:WD40 repeat protein